MSLNTPRGYTYPVYGDATDFPAQIQDLAQDIDTDMQSLFNRVTAMYNQPAARADGSSVQAVANNTNVTAVYDTETYDNSTIINLGTSTSQLTIPSNGIYIAVGSAAWANNGNPSSGACQISIVSSTGPLTVAARSMSADFPVGTAQPTFSNVTVIFSAVAASTVTMVLRQSTGASMNTTSRQLVLAKISVL